MTSVDRHVASVRRKLMIGGCVGALASAALLLAAAALVAIVIDRLFAVTVPDEWRWSVALIASGVALTTSLGVALWRRPSSHDVAVAIDEAMNLRERFSTALFTRPNADAFARAATADAEATAAAQSHVARQFPLTVPRRAYAAAAVGALALGLGIFMPRFDLFGARGVEVAKADAWSAERTARANVNAALAVVGQAPNWRGEDELGRLIDELRDLSRAGHIADPEAANRKAQRALELAGPAKAPAARDDAGAPANPRPMDGDERVVDAGDGKAGPADHDRARPETARDGAANPAAAGTDAATGGKPIRRQGDRPALAGDRLPAAAGGANAGQPNANARQPAGAQAKGNAANLGKGPANAGTAAAAGGNNAAAQPNANGNANAADGNAPGQGANPGPGVAAAAGARGKQTAPFATKVEHSPSQEIEEGRVLARDLVAVPANRGQSNAKVADAVRAERERSADEVDAEHASGPAQSAARKYFRTVQEAAPAGK